MTDDRTSHVFTRRIMGIETEYGITFTHDGQRKLAPDDIARQLFRPIVEQYRSSNIYTLNGGRLYLDVGSHPEYATPECDSLSQLLVYDRAGDIALNDLAVQAEAALQEREIEGRVHLFKNNTDSLGNSYGCHENYLVARSVSLRQLGHELIPFLLTRQLTCGAGYISQPKPGAPNEHSEPGYRLSQRADHVWEGVSSATTRSRPIINTRDEPHADSSLYRRLHVIVGDSNMSETTAALKVGSALLVLEMLEAGFHFDQWAIANEPVAIRAISTDVTGRTPVVLRSGGQSCALEIQQAYCASAAQWLTMRPDNTGGTSNSEMRRVVDLWQRVLDAIDSGDVSSIAQDIDWVMKKSLLDQYMNKYGWDLYHPKMLQLGFAYHDIREDIGIARVLEHKKRMSRWLEWPDGGPSTQAAGNNDSDSRPENNSDAQSGDHLDPYLAVTTAPPTTRAHLRGAFLRRASEHNADVTVDWTRLKINRPEPREIALMDPFDNSDPRAIELISTLSKTDSAAGSDGGARADSRNGDSTRESS